MGLEWIGTAAVGIVGVAATYWTGRESRQAQERLARQGLIQARRADAYVDVLHSANQIGEWSQRLRPVVSAAPAPEPLPLPSPADQMRTWALVSAFASPEVRDRYEEWRDTANLIHRADFKMSLHEQTVAQHGPGSSGINHLEVWQELENVLRPAEHDKRQALEAQVNKELIGP